MVSGIAGGGINLVDYLTTLNQKPVDSILTTEMQAALSTAPPTLKKHQKNEDFVSLASRLSTLSDALAKAQELLDEKRASLTQSANP